MNIVRYPDPRLMARTLAVKDPDDEVRQKINAMYDLMYEEQGVGLAAPQVGWSARIFVMNSTGDREQKEAQRAFLNPRIRKRRGRVIGPEGCLSFPGLFIDVERAAWIQVEFDDPEGTSHTAELDGFEARIFQHELDHLDNVLLVHRMSQADRIRHRDALDRLQRAYEPIG